jgi:uncharacterized protein
VNVRCAFVLAGALVYITAARIATPLCPPQVALALIQAGADVNIAGGSVISPLHAAAAFGLVDVVAVLLAAGAVVDAPDVLGSTPLISAVQSSRGGDCVYALLAAGANPRVVLQDGRTALHVVTVSRPPLQHG